MLMEIKSILLSCFSATFVVYNCISKGSDTLTVLWAISVRFRACSIIIFCCSQIAPRSTDCCTRHEFEICVIVRINRLSMLPLVWREWNKLLFSDKDVALTARSSDLYDVWRAEFAFNFSIGLQQGWSSFLSHCLCHNGRCIELLLSATEPISTWRVWSFNAMEISFDHLSNHSLLLYWLLLIVWR